MGKNDETIEELLKNKLAEWKKEKKDFPGLKTKSKHFTVAEFNTEKGWIVVESDIYPPLNVLDYKTLSNGVKKELSGSLSIRNSNDYSTKVENSKIQRKVGSGISSVSLLTKYYRVLHMEFVRWYKRLGK